MLLGCWAPSSGVMLDGKSFQRFLMTCFDIFKDGKGRYGHRASVAAVRAQASLGDAVSGFDVRTQVAVNVAHLA